MGLLISFLYLCLHIAVIILVAFGLVWLLRAVFNITIDGEVYKWGKIVVALLIIIAIVIWLAGVLGGTRSIAPFGFADPPIGTPNIMVPEKR